MSNIFFEPATPAESLTIDFTNAEIGIISTILKAEVLMEVLETVQETVDYGIRFKDSNVSKDVRKTLTISDCYERYFTMGSELFKLSDRSKPRQISVNLANYLLFLIRDVSGTLDFTAEFKKVFLNLKPEILNKLVAAGASFDPPDLNPQTAFNSPIGLA
jgi:hypothetical protein